MGDGAKTWDKDKRKWVEYGTAKPKKSGYQEFMKGYDSDARTKPNQKPNDKKRYGE